MTAAGYARKMRRYVLRNALHLLLTGLLAAAAGIVLPLSADPAPTPPPAALPAGWTAGQVAAGTATVLKAPDPLKIELPDTIAPLIKGDTALFYFSPTCPHCQHAMPEINQLASEPGNGLTWIGVALGAADP